MKRGELRGREGELDWPSTFKGTPGDTPFVKRILFVGIAMIFSRLIKVCRRQSTERKYLANKSGETYGVIGNFGLPRVLFAFFARRMLFIDYIICYNRLFFILCIRSMSIDKIKTYATMKESFTISVISLNR